MAQYFDNIIGNFKLKSMISSYILNKNMPHAFVIEGARGSGKKLFAKSISAALSCKNKDDSDIIPCMKCINCEKIFADVSPDVIVIGAKQKSSIGVDLIRELKNHTYMTSNELDYKAYIVDDADKMTVGAQNAFLKILEEPVTNVLYFLLCENSQALLPTVISRAPVIRTSPVEKKDIIDYLRTNCKNLQTQELAYIAGLSSGNIGKALLYAEKTDAYTYVQEQRDKVYEILSIHRNDVQKHIFLSSFTNLDDKNGYCMELLRMLYSSMRDIVMYRTASFAAYDFFFGIDDIKKYEKPIKTKYAKKLCILIEETIQQLYLNQGSSSTSSIMQNFALKAWSLRNQ